MCLADQNLEVRLAAAEALDKLSEHAADAAPALLQYLDHEDDEVRFVVVRKRWHDRRGSTAGGNRSTAAEAAEFCGIQWPPHFRESRSAGVRAASTYATNKGPSVEHAARACREVGTR